jgi:hypothetical protein
MQSPSRSRPPTPQPTSRHSPGSSPSTHTPPGIGLRPLDPEPSSQRRHKHDSRLSGPTADHICSHCRCLARCQPGHTVSPTRRRQAHRLYRRPRRRQAPGIRKALGVPMMLARRAVRAVLPPPFHVSGFAGATVWEARAREAQTARTASQAGRRPLIPSSSWPQIHQVSVPRRTRCPTNRSTRPEAEFSRPSLGPVGPSPALKAWCRDENGAVPGSNGHPCGGRDGRDHRHRGDPRRGTRQPGRRGLDRRSSSRSYLRDPGGLALVVAATVAPPQGAG